MLYAATLAAACLPARAQAPLSFEQAIERALQRSEAVRAARSGAASAAESARAAGQVPDPMLRAGIENLPVNRPRPLQQHAPLHHDEAHRLQPGMALQRQAGGALRRGRRTGRP